MDANVVGIALLAGLQFRLPAVFNTSASLADCYPMRETSTVSGRRRQLDGFRVLGPRKRLMTDLELEVLRARLLASKCDTPPPEAQPGEWLESLDTAGGPAQWVQASLYFAYQNEICRRFGIGQQVH